MLCGQLGFLNSLGYLQNLFKPRLCFFKSSSGLLHAKVVKRNVLLRRDYQTLRSNEGSWDSLIKKLKHHWWINDHLFHICFQISNRNSRKYHYIQRPYLFNTNGNFSKMPLNQMSYLLTLFQFSISSKCLISVTLLTTYIIVLS